MEIRHIVFAANGEDANLIKSVHSTYALACKRARLNDTVETVVGKPKRGEHIRKYISYDWEFKKQ